MGFSTKEALGLVAIIAAGIGLAGFAFSGASTDDVRNVAPGDGSGDGVLDRVEEGVSADLSLASYDRTADSTTQVAADIHVWETSDGNFYLGEQAGDNSDRTVFDLVTGDQFEAIAFNDQYPYAEVTEGIVDAETVRENLDVYEAAAAADLDLTVNNEDGDSTSGPISLGSEEQYQFESMEIDLNDNNVGYNPHIVTVGYSDGVDSVEMTGATEVDVPETGEDAVDADNEVAFIPNEFNAQEGEPMMSDWESVETSSLVVTADDAGTDAEDEITVAVQDMAPFISSGQELEYGVEDDASDANELGVDALTATVDLE